MEPPPTIRFSYSGPLSSGRDLKVVQAPKRQTEERTERPRAGELEPRSPDGARQEPDEAHDEPAGQVPGRDERERRIAVALGPDADGLGDTEADGDSPCPRSEREDERARDERSRDECPHPHPPARPLRRPFFAPYQLLPPDVHKHGCRGRIEELVVVSEAVRQEVPADHQLLDGYDRPPIGFYGVPARGCHEVPRHLLTISV